MTFKSWLVSSYRFLSSFIFRIHHFNHRFLLLWGDLEELCGQIIATKMPIGRPKRWWIVRNSVTQCPQFAFRIIVICPDIFQVIVWITWNITIWYVSITNIPSTRVLHEKVSRKKSGPWVISCQPVAFPPKHQAFSFATVNDSVFVSSDIVVSVIQRDTRFPKQVAWARNRALSIWVQYGRDKPTNPTKQPAQGPSCRSTQESLEGSARGSGVWNWCNFVMIGSWYQRMSREGSAGKRLGSVGYFTPISPIFKQVK